MFNDVQEQIISYCINNICLQFSSIHRYIGSLDEMQAEMRLCSIGWVFNIKCVKLFNNVVQFHYPKHYCMNAFMLQSLAIQLHPYNVVSFNVSHIFC